VDVAGDGAFAEFPDVEAALAWARALHDAAEAEGREGQGGADDPPIAFRVAVHAGSVMADGERLFGDAVNLAARLQEYGTPGGVILSAEAAALAPPEALAGARELGELPLRNMSRAVRALSLDPARRVAVPLAPPPTLLPAVAVLPLEDLSEGGRDRYLAAGAMEDVAASLAGLDEVFVISPETTRMFAGASPPPQRVGRTLGVGFVVSGTLRRGGGGFRATVRLCDAKTGEQLWGERIEAAEREVFAVQEHVVARVVAGVAPSIRAAALRAAMRKRPESLTAYDHMLRGVHAMSLHERGGHDAARAHLLAAREADPGFALPLAWMARWHVLGLGLGWSDDPRADTEAALRLGAEALSREPANGLALAVSGHVHGSYLRDADTAADYLERAVAAAPGNPLAWMWTCGLRSYLGDGPAAVAAGERGLRLSPYDPMRFMQHHFLSIARYVAGDLDEAARHAQISLGARAPHASAWRMLAMILAGRGRADEARRAIERMLAMEPGFSVERYMEQRMPFRDALVAERVKLDLRAAGAPE
jgi:adenylate cyclase